MSYVLTLVDTLNDSIGSTSVASGVDIIGVGENKVELKKKVEGEVSWTVNELKQDIGYCVYDGEIDNDQYYVIVDVR